MDILNPSDLTEIERAVLAILGSGIVPSSVANDSGFRLDYLTAVTLALLQNQQRDAFLVADGTATPQFQRDLSDALYDLSDRRVLALGTAPANPLLTFEVATDEVATNDGVPEDLLRPSPGRASPVSFDQHPTVFDRYLAGRCLDEILRHPDAYTFIMGKYADSSEVWQRVYKQYT